MMSNIDPDSIVDELLFDIGLDVTDDEKVTDLISCSGSSGWGYDTSGNLKTWLIQPGTIGFSVHIYLDGIPDDDTSILGTSILAKVQG